MNILVTAGNTQVPIDRVRTITNIFTGRTGYTIALSAHRRGHQVTLLTSVPGMASAHDPAPPVERWNFRFYRTFDELAKEMSELVRQPALEVLIHCAAVSDYRTAGIYAPTPLTHFRANEQRWEADAGAPTLVDMAAGKVKSDAPELWLRLVRTPKLVDLVRTEWGFRGLLVKFKLEVGISDERLLEIAEKSRVHSAADLMVANTLEGSATCAYLGPLAGNYERVSRRELADRLLTEVERLHQERTHG